MDNKFETGDISDEDEWTNLNANSKHKQNNNKTRKTSNKNKSTKKPSTGGIWPADDFTDSEDEQIERNSVKAQQRVPDIPEGLTEEEINGGFPVLKTTDKSDEDSSDDETQKPKEPEKKTNPYLAHMNQNDNKYSDKLRELHLKRNEARKLNHQEVSAEDQRLKLPANYEARRKRAEWELEEQKSRKEAEELGEDYDKIKLLEETAEDIEIYENRKRKKKNLDPGFSDYAQAQLRQYEGLTKKIKPDMVVYENKKSKLGDLAFPSAHNVMYGGNSKCSEEAIDRMVGDLDKQIEKRAKFHRRRQHHDEADIDYINEKNMKFNQKAERFYGEYTKEIRENLERGTAI